MQIRRLPSNAPARAMRRIARQYVAAIIRRGREATDPTFLADKWRAVNSHFVRQGQTFLFMRKLGPVYVATHFAPATLRGGYRLLTAIARHRLPVVFAVPDDLARDLERLGWRRVPRWAEEALHQRGVPEEKTVLFPRAVPGILTAAWQALMRQEWSNEGTEQPLLAHNPRRALKKSKARTAQDGPLTYRPFRSLPRLWIHGE